MDQGRWKFLVEVTPKDGRPPQREVFIGENSAKNHAEGLRREDVGRVRIVPKRIK